MPSTSAQRRLLCERGAAAAEEEEEEEDEDDQWRSLDGSRSSSKAWRGRHAVSPCVQGTYST